MLAVKKSVVALLASTGCLLAGTRDAAAQDCTRTGIVTNSTGYAVAATMAGRYMRLANAATYADRRLLKVLDDAKPDYDGGKGVFGIRWDWLFGASDGQAYLAGNGCSPVAKVPFDMYSSNFGLAFAYSHFYGFYSSSVGAAAAQDNFGRYAGATVTPILGNLYSVAAPFTGAKAGTTAGIIYSFDYIAGVGVQHRYINASAGYVGSSGFFGRITQVDTKLAGAAALRAASQELAYLRAGLDYLKILKDHATTIAPYFRQIQQSPPQRLLNAQEGVFDDVKDLKGFAFRTAHLEIADLLKYLDVQAAYGLPPFNNLHQLGLRGHTPGVSLAGPPRDAKGLPKKVEGGFALAVGMVRVPEQRLLDQKGGALLNVSAEAIFFNGMGRLAFHLNSPEILSQYPTAANSVNITFEVAGTPGQGGR